MRFKLFISFLTIISFTAHAQNEDSLFIRSIADEILVNGLAYENLRVLTKQVGPRLAGSQGMVRAEAWGQKTLEKQGADKVWLQQCMVPHWVRGGKDEAHVINAQKKNPKLDVLALGNSVGTGPKGVTAPVILINTFDELEQRKDEVKGKIVFYNYRFNDKFVKTFQAYGDAGRYRGAGPSRAARYGAVAVIVRSMTNAADNNPHTGATSYNDSFPKIPAIAVGLQDANKLADMIRQEKNVNIFLRTNAKMLPDTIGHNVIGELAGTEFPDQIITIGGHLDSWDPAEGAHDDGAGCVQSIEVLRVLKVLGYKPKHTIRVVLFANEENGLRGGNRYAEEAKAKNEKHIFALESDAGGFTPRGFGFTMKPEQLEKVRNWAPLFLPYGVYELNQGGGGADIGPLSRTFGTPLAGLQPDSQRYFDIHHARSDVFEAVNKRELELGAINMAALIYLIDKYGL
jgi:carboxypeptidase Q